MLNLLANRRGVVRLAVLVAGTTLCACALTGCVAMSKPSKAMSPQVEANDPDICAVARPKPAQEKASKIDKIKALWAKIIDQRRAAKLDVPIADEMATRVADKSVSQARAICERPEDPPLLCQDVCTLADSICDNAENICRLAGELGDDDWANERCASAKASCADAATRCCDCR